ncbi:plasmid replication, integration and excision activator [Pseudonocardia xishanensis]|uniref:Uncharacterized protein n=1 Tax=Pseudonocardia xishanensis TaxID=630995 RepID=A0ABP8RLL5_9PSEU
MQGNTYAGYNKFPSSMEQLMPFGAWLVSGVEPIKDFDASGRGPDEFVQARDKDTGLPLWMVTVQSGDLENAPAWLHRLKVKVVAERQPELPPVMPGTPFRPVYLEGLVVVPYMDDKACTPAEPGRRHRCRAKVAYSVRASGIRAPRTNERPAPSQENAA